jgi:hypothetical protein
MRTSYILFIHSYHSREQRHCSQKICRRPYVQKMCSEISWCYLVRDSLLSNLLSIRTSSSFFILFLLLILFTFYSFYSFFSFIFICFCYRKCNEICFQNLLQTNLCLYISRQKYPNPVNWKVIYFIKKVGKKAIIGYDVRGHHFL